LDDGVAEFLTATKKRKQDLVEALGRLRDRADYGQLVQEQVVNFEKLDQALKVSLYEAGGWIKFAFPTEWGEEER